MNRGQKSFSSLLEAYPNLQKYWDLEKNECDVDALKAAFGTMAHGEKIMAQFIAAVWFGRNELGFDITDAAATLDDEEKLLIANWLREPFWP